MKDGEAGVLQFTGLQRVGHDLRLNVNNKEGLRLSWRPSGKESACRCRRCGLSFWVGKISWRRRW